MIKLCYVLAALVLLIILTMVMIAAVLYQGDLSREQLSQYQNAHSRFMQLPNGATMHYRAEGNPNAPALVMIHGGLGSLHHWQGWVEALSNDFRLISMDLLGHGLTGRYPGDVYDRIAERDAVVQLLQLLGVERYALAGNSFGGGIALEIALAHPQHVLHLILVDSEGVADAERGYDASMFSGAEAVAPQSPRYTQLSWLEALGSRFISRVAIRAVLEQMVADQALLTDEFVSHISEINRHVGNREAQILMFRQGLHLIQQNGPSDLLPRLAELEMPVLVINGKQDTLVSVEIAELFHRHIAGSELLIVEGASHMPMMEKPVETAQAVRSFILPRRD